MHLGCRLQPAFRTVCRSIQAAYDPIHLKYILKHSNCCAMPKRSSIQTTDWSAEMLEHEFNQRENRINRKAATGLQNDRPIACARRGKPPPLIAGICAGEREKTLDFAPRGRAQASRAARERAPPS
jgi:hypothetical protein